MNRLLALFGPSKRELSLLVVIQGRIIESQARLIKQFHDREIRRSREAIARADRVLAAAQARALDARSTDDQTNEPPDFTVDDGFDLAGNEMPSAHANLLPPDKEEP